MDGNWMGGWMGGKAGLRIAYSNQKLVLVDQEEEKLEKECNSDTEL